MEQIYLGTSDIPDDIRIGGRYVADGIEKPFPAVGTNFHFGWKKDARELVLKDRDGRIRLKFVFEAPSSIMFQDNHQFGEGVELRIVAQEKSLSPGRFVEWGLVLSEPEPLMLVEPAPFAVNAGNEWVPVSIKGGIIPGSALDFSAISGLDAPAGRHGRVVVRNGHFEFSDVPGVTRRFYGVNLCFGANYFQSLESADCFAEELARRGYNAIRLHHHDGMFVEKMGNSTTINPQRMRELDALAAAFIRRGIYITTDLYVSRPVPWKEIGEDKPGNIDMGEFPRWIAA